jgi:hypothetical protein
VDDDVERWRGGGGGCKEMWRNSKYNTRFHIRMEEKKTRKDEALFIGNCLAL